MHLRLIRIFLIRYTSSAPSSLSVNFWACASPWPRALPTHWVDGVYNTTLIIGQNDVPSSTFTTRRRLIVTQPYAIRPQLPANHFQITGTKCVRDCSQSDERGAPPTFTPIFHDNSNTCISKLIQQSQN